MAIDWDQAVLAPCFAVFGEAVQAMYQPAASGAPAFPVDVIFDNAFLAVVLTADGIPEMATVNPVGGVRLAQFPSPPLSGDRITVASVAKTYLVNEVKPDGKGWAKLELNLSS